ncbi:hypothetical protein A8709_11455 [Paenibacillus pectinilyticus]|uniref:Uncharacterized protein n=1 Tax=Paenibacillus pectinilyticus TaxID=512399 RepID=A0A1C1A2L4_9BACL|nr:hypothetical protein [Paenibacillus pectinilyticus]OCT14780.1 hypothetical protein A8709_11455 [Paenibacillus pectinilyticus]
MEYVKVPNYPVQPMPMPMPTPMPMPMPAPAPIMQQPAHNDIHLHASYSHNEFVFPKPVHTQAVAAPCYPKNNAAASILVLFILLVIITRGICKY